MDDVVDVDGLIDGLIEREGGYVDHPADKGGPTCFGITQAVARAQGYAGPMRELPRITLAQRSDMPRTIVQEMRAALVNANPVQLSFCEGGARPGVIELADAIVSSAGELSDAVADAYFQHASRSRTGSGPIQET